MQTEGVLVLCHNGNSERGSTYENDCDKAPKINIRGAPITFENPLE